MRNGKRMFDYLPVSLFGAVMGLSGLGAAWRLASAIYGAPRAIWMIISLLAAASFAVLCVCYLLKVITAFDAFKSEYEGPLTRSFFGTFVISLLLLPLVTQPFFPSVAKILWCVGTILMFLFALHIVSFWLGVRHEQVHVTPAWIIPVVGTLDIPLAYKMFDFPWGHEASLAALGIGLFFAVPVFTIVISRIIFFEPMPSKLTPSMMILIAPFAVGFSAYTEVTGGTDTFAKILYFTGLFIFLTLLPQIGKSRFCCPFKITWWAVSFPLSAILAATLKMAVYFDNAAFHAFAQIFLAGVTAVILWLSVRTLRGITRGDLRSLS